MLRFRNIGIAWIVVMSFAFLGAASAQGVTGPFNELNSRVRPGETVDVTDGSGQTIRGRLLTINAEALLIEAASRRVGFSIDQVERVRVQRPDSFKNGILTGLATGAASGAVLALLADNRRPSTPCTFVCGNILSPGDAAVAGAMLGGAVGIGVGAVVDALRRERPVVYERPSSSGPRVAIIPFVRGRSAGFAALLRV